MNRCVSIVTTTLFWLGSYATAANAADCDRECLANVATQYLEALVEHSPANMPLSDSLKFTENTALKRPGEGFWQTASKRREARPGAAPYRLDVLDAEQGTAVTFGVFEENGAPVLHVARLKVADGLVTELETMIVRSQPDGGGIFEPQMLQHPSDAMTRVPAADAIERRAAAVAIAEHYPAGIRVGSFVKVDAPFAPNAYRLENGRLMAGPGCTFAQGCGDIKTQRIPTYPATYRVIAYDEQLGIVVLRQNYGPRPYDASIELHTWHAFKVYGGEIHAVEAFQNVMPTGTKSGWD